MAKKIIATVPSDIIKNADSLCHQETFFGNCTEHKYHKYDAFEDDDEPGQVHLDPQVQEVLKDKHRQQEEDELYDDLDSPSHPDNNSNYGPNHMATVTNIWDAKSVRGRQFPKE